MKILCALSSIEFDCSHFPGTFYSRELHHPIFSLPQKKLLAATSKWSSGELTSTDSYLLFLSLLRSSDLIDWRVPVIRTEQTDSIIANNMESLLRTVIKLNTVSDPAQTFPHYAISQDTRTLANVRYWIENWQHAYDEHKSGYKSAHESAALIRRENALARMIKNPHRPISAYSGELSIWAAAAGNFPTFPVSSPFGSSFGQQITCADFWKEIIVRCTKNDYIFSIPDGDLIELIEHCEEHIPIGSIYSHALFKILRDAQSRKRNFLDIGDPDVKSSYSLISSSASVESANMKALVDSAPATEPRIEQYPSRFAYQKAKLRWDMARKYAKDQASDESAHKGDCDGIPI